MHSKLINIIPKITITNKNQELPITLYVTLFKKQNSNLISNVNFQYHELSSLDNRCSTHMGSDSENIVYRWVAKNIIL